MKKIVFTGVLCFLVSLSFGQKKAVSDAKNEMNSAPPNFEEARKSIKEALANPETANSAEAWYVAGLIENKQFDTERALQILGKQPNEEVMYSALDAILPYFLKAGELDQLPDDKGKIKPKYLKDIRSMVRANRPFYINAGLFANDKKDYQKAYDNFKLYGDIPSMPMFKDEKWGIVEGDTTELQIRYYTGLMASLIPDHQAAIAIYKELISKPYTDNGAYKETEIYQRLADEYKQIKDSASYEKIVKEGYNKFPGDDYYVLNLINVNIYAGKTAEALTYLEKAIAQHPENAQLYDVKGQVYEVDKNYDEAIKAMKKALQLEPNNIDYLSHLGRVYFNIGVEKRTASDETSDVNKSKELAGQSQDSFRASMPLFEKVFNLDPKNSGAIYALRSIYYSLNMNDEYKKMDELYNKNNNE